jgi:hypothetical protein
MSKDEKGELAINLRQAFFVHPRDTSQKIEHGHISQLTSFARLKRLKEASHDLYSTFS